MRNRYVLLALLLLFVFLLGFVPMYTKYAALDSQYKQSARRIENLELRDSAGVLYFQAVQKNYGLAGHSSTDFFNRVQELAGKAESADRKRALDEIFSARDKVTTLLARGDPAVLSELQTLYMKTRGATTP